jgi:hypothetical protein
MEDKKAGRTKNINDVLLDLATLIRVIKVMLYLICDMKLKSHDGNFGSVEQKHLHVESLNSNQVKY